MMQNYVIICSLITLLLVSCQATYMPSVPSIYVPQKMGETSFQIGLKGVGLQTSGNVNVYKGLGLTWSGQAGLMLPLIMTGGAYDFGINYKLPKTKKQSEMLLSLTVGEGVNYYTNGRDVGREESSYYHKQALFTLNKQFPLLKTSSKAVRNWGYIIQTGMVAKDLYFKEPNSQASFGLPLNAYTYYTSHRKSSGFYMYGGIACATNSLSIKPQLGLGLNIRLFYPKEIEKK